VGALGAAVLFAAGCGGEHVAADGGVEAAAGDAAPEAAAPEDARVVADGGCTFEFQVCGGDAGPCGDPALDCVPVGIDPSKNALCLRRCSGTADCPFNSYCVPDRSQILFGGLYLAERHCFGSLCGPTYGNGTPFGACRVGGDNLVRLDRAEQRPGTCIPVDSDAGTGFCAENGNADDGGGVPAAGRDQPCTADPVGGGCLPRTRITGCEPGLLCVAHPGDTDGICALMCDPTRAAPSDPSTCTASPESERQWCEDASRITKGASGLTHVGYFGICQTTPACDLFSSATDCAAGQGCYPTTMVNPHGLCLAVGQATDECVGDLDCAPGSVCISEGLAGPLRCRALCDLGTGTHGCPDGQSCEPVGLDPQQPAEVSLTWGVCATAAATDGGVPDAL
jgi:hypothetical protein